MRPSHMLLTYALLLAPISAGADESAPCRITGGGCLRVDGPNSKLESTFGGNVPSLHGPWQGSQGAQAHTWEHVYRDGRTILFTLHSSDAHVVRCRPERPGPCPPPGGATRVEFAGTAVFSTGPGPEVEQGNFEASVVDVGTCGPGIADSYAITVRRGPIIGIGEVVYEASGQISCGNIQAFAPWENAAH